ncbi:c-type cytochrome [Peteryoungia ipomoeae]|uniref:Cytochrome c family protein n=1 Tax=Peteryoungia ipomoeae TaxID=1210932 RepID=A0A4S8NUQ9_9HYPH|nr:cytochrome c family protein [Peteryoungia ipomoeae]THV21313.1 cytochrome c family protein [Peteryoungia ipomoeae]
MKISAKLILLAALGCPAVAMAGGDPVAGAKAFKACQACHTASEAKNKVGPHLVGIVGRAVGTAEGYKYSPAMTEFGAGKVWDEALLTAYLKAPKGVIKGTKMAYAGMKKEEDIVNLLAYLKDPAAAGQ